MQWAAILESADTNVADGAADSGMTEEALLEGTLAVFSQGFWESVKIKSTSTFSVMSVVLEHRLQDITPPSSPPPLPLPLLSPKPSFSRAFHRHYRHNHHHRTCHPVLPHG